MKNKGFTLVEIMAVITIVAIVVLILVPSIDSLIKSSKDDTYDMQIKLMEESLQNWAAKNVFALPTNENETLTITLADLKKGGFIDPEVRTSKTNECFSNNIELVITKKNNKYTYKVDTETLSFYESETCDVIE